MTDIWAMLSRMKNNYDMGPHTCTLNTKKYKEMFEINLPLGCTNNPLYLMHTHRSTAVYAEYEWWYKCLNGFL